MAIKKEAKSWRAKLTESKGLPKVVGIPEKMSKRWKVSGTMVVPAPIEVDEAMRKVPRGKLTTINDIRSSLARKHEATICCQITAGIFSVMSARAAEEAKAEGKKDITPYWRTLKSGGELNEKYPCGVAGQKSFLEKEGHTIVRKGSKSIVENHERCLFKFGD